MARLLVEIVPRTFEFEVAETEVYGGRKLDGWFGNIGLKAQALDFPRKDAKTQRRKDDLGIKRYVAPFFAPFFAPLRLCGKYFSTPRARNDYATHVPILIGLAKTHKIRCVLEFGCGHTARSRFSTVPHFLDLERLQSIENDAAWADALRESVDDVRWESEIYGSTR